MNSKTALKQVLIYLTIILIIILIPILGVISIVYSVPDAYKDDYARGLILQYNYLKETKNEDRIIIIGTSSAAFGIDGDMIANQFNKKVVIFGLYGAIGNMCMLDWADPYIHEGDIVIWLYDIYKEALSENYDPETALKAIYGNVELFNGLSKEYKKQTISALPAFIKTNIEYNIKNIQTGSLGVYNKQSFDERGYMIYERNGWNSSAAPIQSDNFVEIDMISDDFTNKVATWAQKQRDKKAVVYTHYGPLSMNSKGALVTDSQIDKFSEVWESKIQIKAISKLKNSYLDATLFYDGAYHLNSKGARYFTSIFIRNLETAIYGGSSYPLESIK